MRGLTIMKKMYKYFYSLLLVLGFVQFDGAQMESVSSLLAATDYSNISQDKLYNMVREVVWEYRSHYITELEPNFNYWRDQALIAVAVKGHIHVLKMLIHAGADVNAKERCGTNPSGTTALMYAVKYGYVDIIEELIKAGANVNESDNDPFCTALFYAVNYDRMDIARRLLQIPGIKIIDYDYLPFRSKEMKQLINAFEKLH